MANLIEEMQALCEAENDLKPFTNFTKLEPGPYEIERFVLLNTKFGKKTAVAIGDFILCLPSRVNIIRTPERLAELNAETGYVFDFISKDKKKKTDESI